jgi:NAD+ diphosphatase
MLQDLAFGRLENEYRPAPPADSDLVICVRDGAILVSRGKNDALTLPRVSQILSWCDFWETWYAHGLQFAFRLHGNSYFLWLGQAGDCPDDAFAYIPARQLRQTPSRAVCYAAMTGWHLYNWYRTSRFCGRCGEKTSHDSVERMMRCPNCGNMIFPRINPAIIVGVIDGERILLTKYAGRGYTSYALIAGFTEIGETLEQTVAREVMEEVGLTVKNIRYYKSQPWGIDGNILMGFFCDLDGDDTISLDENELALAQWHHRNSLPVEDDGYSLTREMIRIFGEGREPK